MPGPQAAQAPAMRSAYLQITSSRKLIGIKGWYEADCIARSVLGWTALLLVAQAGDMSPLKPEQHHGI